jgi:hypothetical protein
MLPAGGHQSHHRRYAGNDIIRGSQASTSSSAATATTSSTVIKALTGIPVRAMIRSSDPGDGSDTAEGQEGSDK